MTFVNLTPHEINLNNGESFQPSGKVARVESKFSEIVDDNFDHRYFTESYGEIENLPKPYPNTRFIVSGIVFAATDRMDVVKPATGHPDTVRNDKGHIVSVPGFVFKK